MKKQIEHLNNEFIKINKAGWIKSKRKGSTGVGKTFEELIGKTEDRKFMPDYNGIEIKTKRYYSNSFTTLFNLTPSGMNEKETVRLKSQYGYPDQTLKCCKVLNNSIFASKRTWIGTKFQFQLQVDRSREKLVLLVFDCAGNLIEKNSYWSFEGIKERLNAKIKIIAFIEAERKLMNGDEYFKYISISFYQLKGFDEFINLLEKGIVRVTFKISIFKNGLRKGEMHDHGTGFDINEKDFVKLFDKINL